MTAHILDSRQDWRCPSCGLQDTTPTHVPTRFHHCPKLGITAPLIPALSDARHVLVERQDYVSGEIVQTANGRPVMALVTERADGSNDCTVYAGTAQATANN